MVCAKPKGKENEGILKGEGPWGQTQKVKMKRLRRGRLKMKRRWRGYGIWDIGYWRWVSRTLRNRRTVYRQLTHRLRSTSYAGQDGGQAELCRTRRIESRPSFFRIWGCRFARYRSEAVLSFSAYSKYATALGRVRFRVSHGAADRADGCKNQKSVARLAVCSRKNERFSVRRYSACPA